MEILNKILNAVKTVIPLNFWANDPAEPVKIDQTIPALPKPCPSFSVQGFTGSFTNVVHSSTWQAAGVYTMMANSLTFVQNKLVKKLTRWPRVSTLVAVPRAGQQFNAYYDGSTLRFFYGKHPKENRYIFTCESSDIVTHELGHAILDTIRPDLWTTQAVEILSFHESFGDINAIFTSLSYPQVVDFMLNETHGNLKSNNIVSKLAEEMGMAIYAGSGKNVDCLRNAVNTFTYVNPSTLPNFADDRRLAKEPHSFSRVFTGALYDTIVYQFNKNVQTMSQKDALVAARDQVSRVFYNAISSAALTSKFYDAVARAMLAVDNNNGGLCRDAINQAFSERGIIQSIPLLLSTPVIACSGEPASTYGHTEGTNVRFGGVKTIKLIEEMAITQSDNPLYAIDVDVPNEHYIEYDVHGRVKLYRTSVVSDVLGDVKDCLDFLHQTHKVDYDNKIEPNKEFSVVDGKLVRNFICCKHCKREI